MALCLSDRGPQVSPPHAIFQRNEPLAVLAINVGRAILQIDLGDVAQRDISGGRFRICIWDRDRDGADGVDVVAILRSQSDGQGEVHLAFEDARDFLPADRGLHNRVDVANRDAVTRRLGAIDPNQQVRLSDEVERRWVPYPGHPCNFGFD